MKKLHFLALTLGFALGALAMASCTKKPSATTIRIDGSSTVFPITEAVAEEFQKQSKSRVTIGVSGTGGGFKKFCAKGIAIAEASRAIKPAESKHCDEAQVEFIEIPIAYDGIVVAVHPENDWASDISIAELKKLWEPDAQGKILKWSQVRAGWPDKEISLFAPGVDSGTYDYFTQAVVGKEHASRGDITSSEDDNVLVQGVSTDRYSLGFFGFSYYTENKSKIKALSIDGVSPTYESILDSRYRPLSRPVFLYVSKKELEQVAVGEFMEFYLTRGPALIKEVGYVPLSPKAYTLSAQRVRQKTVGSLFVNATADQSLKIEQILGETSK